MIVVDASAVLDALIRAPSAELLDRQLFGTGQGLHAPHLLDLEITQVLRRHVSAGLIQEERGRAALADLLEFPLRRHPHYFLLPRVWELRQNLTAYDAVYVALAEMLDLPLLTRDRRLAAAAKQYVQVEVV